MTRSAKKGPFVDHHLLVKIEKASATKDKKPIKTWSRRSTILPEFIGLTIACTTANTRAVYVREHGGPQARRVRPHAPSRAPGDRRPRIKGWLRHGNQSIVRGVRLSSDRDAGGPTIAAKGDQALNILALHRKGRRHRPECARERESANESTTTAAT